MKICSYCGTKLKDGVRFCPVCGKNLVDEKDEVRSLKQRIDELEMENRTLRNLNDNLSGRMKKLEEENERLKAGPDVSASIKKEYNRLKDRFLHSQDAADQEQGKSSVQPVSSGRICPNCGAKVPENALFCVSCGQRLQQPEK